MSAANYKKAFDDAADELERSLLDRQNLDLRILELRDAVFAMANMLDEGDSKRHRRFDQLLAELRIAAPNLTDAVRDAVYYAPSQKVAAPHARDHVVKRNPDLAGTPNLLAGVHSTLKRLVRQGELNSELIGGETVYSWAGPTFGARTSLANRLALASDPGQSKLENSLPSVARRLLRKRVGHDRA